MSKKIYLLLLLAAGFADAQIVNIPDVNFKAKLLAADVSNSTASDFSNNAMKIDANGNGEIEVAEAALVRRLSFQSSNISDITGIGAFVNLEIFGCHGNPLVNVDLLNGLTQLKNLAITGNVMGSSTLSITNLPALLSFSFTYSTYAAITISGSPNLSTVTTFASPNLTNLNLIGLTGLKKLTSFDCNLSNVLITDSPLLEEIDLSQNELTQIDIDYMLLKKLDLGNNHLTSTSGFSNFDNLTDLNISSNLFANIALPAMPALINLQCSSNLLSFIDLSQCANLYRLLAAGNNFTTLDLSNVPALMQLSVSQNDITSLDFSNLPFLSSVNVENNLFTELDFSHNPAITNLTFYNNPNLTHINLKNGAINTLNYGPGSFDGLANLQYICIDEVDILNFSLFATPPIVSVTSYCNFNPGGDYNTITGGLTFDYNNDGCDDNDLRYPYLKVVVNDGTAEGSTFTNASGNYTFYTQAGTFNVQPQLEQPNYFSVSPTVATLNFPLLDNSVQTQNFCISDVGLHPDLEIVLTPLQAARPGFDVDYAITYRNKGNQAVSGAVTLAFDDDHANFTASNPAADNQQINLVGWNFANLQPFETRSIHFTLRLNSTVNTPALNSGDTLHFTSTITFFEGDETPADNSFELHQLVVNAYDPNDKTCLEGTSVRPENIGKYLHYNINFENTGTADAINIVVKDTIDTTRFDINTLQLLYASHPVNTKITGNVVEFIFENINLPPSIINPIGGHGNVLFKIKTLPTLTVGDEVSNTANIYFDYNAPIDTNEARTAFNNLSKSDFVKDDSVTVYPNPAKNKVTVKATGIVKSVQLYDVQGRILQSVLESKSQITLDITNQQSGVYFLKITTDKGNNTQKIIKE